MCCKLTTYHEDRQLWCGLPALTVAMPFQAEGFPVRIAQWFPVGRHNIAKPRSLSCDDRGKYEQKSKTGNQTTDEAIGRNGGLNPDGMESGSNPHGVEWGLNIQKMEWRFKLLRENGVLNPHVNKRGSNPYGV